MMGTGATGGSARGARLPVSGRHHHYESAFERCLRCYQCPYVRVDEQKRAVFAGARVKSFDFLVYPSDGAGWLVDVKGRRFPSIGAGGRRYWENWVTRDDLAGMAAWEGVFGAGFEGVFVFAYVLGEPADRPPPGPVFHCEDRRYVFLAIRAGQYRVHARRRSTRWDTVSVATATFRRLSEPVFPVARASGKPAPALPPARACYNERAWPVMSAAPIEDKV